MPSGRSVPFAPFSPRTAHSAPPAGAVTSEDAEAATAAFGARGDVRPRDAALPFAWSTAATLDPYVDGERFFGPILADVEAARSSVHVLMFGWREGEIGMRLARLLERKLGEGVAVRVIVDELGSRPYWNARAMFSALAARGAEIVINDVVPPARLGLFPDGCGSTRARASWAAPTGASTTSWCASPARSCGRRRRRS